MKRKNENNIEAGENLTNMLTITKSIFTEPMIGMLATAKRSKKHNKDIDNLSDDIEKLLDNKQSIVIYKALSLCLVRVILKMGELDTIEQFKSELNYNDVMVQ